MDYDGWSCEREFIVYVADQFTGLILRLCGKLFALQVVDRLTVSDF